MPSSSSCHCRTSNLLRKGKSVCVHKFVNRIRCQTLEWTNNGIDFEASNGDAEACWSLGSDFANFKIYITVQAFQGILSETQTHHLTTDSSGDFCVPIPLNTTSITATLTLKFPPEADLKCTNACAANSAKCGCFITQTKKGVTLTQTFSPYTFDLVWRSWSGDGNNLLNPSWGMRHTALVRQAPADYADGISTLAVRGATNPSPRVISNSICKSTGSKPNSMNLSDMVWVWGQFLDHEIDLTPEDTTEDISIVTPDTITDPNEDYPGRTITIHRSGFIAGTSPREQPNRISSFIDATNIYGYIAERAYALRSLDGTGKLKITTSDNGEDILIYNTAGFDNAMPPGSTASDFFLSGDIRANENILLISMHTLFTREHNLLCDEIVAQIPEWTGKDELIYQHARRIVIGKMQNITYKEFLPALLGSDAIPEYTHYDSSLDPSIRTEFSSALYRFGHSMLSSTLKVGTSGTINLRDAFFTPSYIQTNGIDELLHGAFLQVMQEIDGEMVDDVRNFLFGPPTAMLMLDLATLNIQRGRDHGLPGYNAVRNGYGLATKATFSSITSDVTIQSKLASLYDSPNSIDPLIGALVEDHLPGKAVGELLYTSLVSQFTRLRDGDRFWYQVDPGLNQATIDSISKTKLSDIIIRNTGLTSAEVPTDVFHVSVP